MNISAVIIAGGVGSRFWPLSRKEKPKQFLPIISDKTMIEETIQRISPKISSSDIYTVANSKQTSALAGLLPKIPQENFLVEPEGKKTKEYYINGLSTSLPYEAQIQIVRSVPGLENAVIVRPAYAVEYDFAYPDQLQHSLESKIIEGLLTKALATETLCRCPPDNSLGLCVILSAKPTS